MKTKLAIAVALALVSSAAWSADEGFYVGASIGMSDVSASSTFKYSATFPNEDPIKDSYKADFSSSDFGWSIYVGYDFNKYVAAELGYIDLGSPSDDVDKGSYDCTDCTDTYKTTVDLSSLAGVDLAVVGKVPLGESWDVHAKLGVIWWSPEATARYKETFTDGTVTEVYTEKLTNTIDATDLLIGVGATWKLNENIMFGLDWTHIEFSGFGSLEGDSFYVDSITPDTTDLYAVSATYKF